MYKKIRFFPRSRHGRVYREITAKYMRRLLVTKKKYRLSSVVSSGKVHFEHGANAYGCIQYDARAEVRGRAEEFCFN